LYGILVEPYDAPTVPLGGVPEVIWRVVPPVPLRGAICGLPLPLAAIDNVAFGAEITEGLFSASCGCGSKRWKGLRTLESSEEFCKESLEDAQAVSDRRMS